MKVADLFVGKRLFLGCGNPEALGRGPLEVRGSGYLQGPTITGAAGFPNVWATSMIGPLANPESPTPFIPGAYNCFIPPANPFSLAVVGPTALAGIVQTTTDVIVGKDLAAQGDVVSNCGAHVLRRKKNFDIPHPSKKGYRLRHYCREDHYYYVLMSVILNI
mgnify:CR=1 FL=1